MGALRRVQFVTPRLTIFVHGTPRPKGSMKVAGSRKTAQGKSVARLTDSCKSLPAWRDAIRAALDRHGPAPQWPAHSPVFAELRFTFKRPPSHFKNKKAGALSSDGLRMKGPTGRGIGDLDKLERGVLDELTGPVLYDDAQVVGTSPRKVWGKREGVEIKLYDACAECARAVHVGRYHVCMP